MAFSKITTRGMSGDTLEAGDIAANAVGASELADNAVDTAAIASGAVTNAKIPDDLIQVKPHIKPGTLYPAWRGLIDGHTGFTFTDSSATPKTITPAGTGNVSHSAGQKKFGSTSIYFDGVVGDYLEITDHADFTFGTGNFTIEFFVNMGDQAATYTTLFHSANHDLRVNIGASATAPKLTFYSDTWDAHTSGTTDIGDNAWHHCAIVRVGTDLKIYVDGALEATRASSGNSLDPDNIRIGQYATSHPFKGYIDDIRITKGLAVYTGAFTAPTSALTTTWSANPFGGSNTAANSTASNVSFLLHSDNGGNSGAYGTAQSDGKKYYYTDITGSKTIKDPRIGAHFGSQRHKLKSLQLLEQETATHGNDVYSVDGREWLRVVGKNWQAQNTANGNFIYNEECNDGTTEYIEVTGYFNFLTHLDYTNPANGVIKLISVDGSADGTSQNSAGSDTPLANRFVDTGSVNQINLSALSLGIHTVRFGFANDTMSYAIELIAQDTSNRSKIQIPSQNVVSYGKKFTVSGTPHYDPFNGMSGAKTLTELGTFIDTATSLGMDNWKAGTSNYYKPFNGGRVVRWVDSSGTIKTSVTMMPPNAQNMTTTASNAFSDGEVQAGTNDHTITFNTTAIDHSLSEVARTYMAPEFGNGGANGHNDFRDMSTSINMDTSGGHNFGHVLDDGLTSITAYGGKSVPAQQGFLPDAADDYSIVTFIGTGVSYRLSTYQAGFYHCVMNVPYGTHTVQNKWVSGNDSKIIFDGIDLGLLNDAGYGSWADITFYQPKMPPIPDDACILADYMLMASYVQNTSATIGTISKGVRRIGGSRDHFYSCGGAIVAMGGGTTYPWFYYGPGSHSGNTMAVSLPYFGTSFTSFAEDQSQTHTFTLDGSAVTPTEADSDETRADLFYHTVSTLGLHTKVHTLPAGGYRFAGTDVASPTHSSSHYQTFETPFLHELVGGDRNMEQNNLVVTPDGKTWDEVTRDTSYIGNGRIQITYDGGDGNDTDANFIFDFLRGTKTGKPSIQKDFAHLYGRVICIKDGEYDVKWDGIARTGNTQGQARMFLNGSEVRRAEIQPGSAGRGQADARFTMHLKRGDYLTIQSGNDLEGNQDEFLCYLRITKG